LGRANGLEEALVQKKFGLPQVDSQVIKDEDNFFFLERFLQYTFK
jgi:hypothetical protein